MTCSYVFQRSWIGIVELQKVERALDWRRPKTLFHQGHADGVCHKARHQEEHLQRPAQQAGRSHHEEGVHQDAWSDLWNSWWWLLCVCLPIHAKIMREEHLDFTEISIDNAFWVVELQNEAQNEPWVKTIDGTINTKVPMQNQPKFKVKNVQ